MKQKVPKADPLPEFEESIKLMSDEDSERIQNLLEENRLIFLNEVELANEETQKIFDSLKTNK